MIIFSADPLDERRWGTIYSEATQALWGSALLAQVRSSWQFLCAEQDGVQYAVVVYSVNPEGGFWIEIIYTRPAYRRTGLATVLCDKLILIARATEAPYIGCRLPDWVQ